MQAVMQKMKGTTKNLIWSSGGNDYGADEMRKGRGRSTVLCNDIKEGERVFCGAEGDGKGEERREVKGAGVGKTGKVKNVAGAKKGGSMQRVSVRRGSRVQELDWSTEGGGTCSGGVAGEQEGRNKGGSGVVQSKTRDFFERGKGKG